MKTKFVLSAVTLILLVVIGWLVFKSKPVMRLVVCDVGQGDAVLLSLPDGEQILVDGGPDRAVLGCLGKYLPLFRQRLDKVVLTHGHADHVAGLISVLERYPVGEVVSSGLAVESATYQAWTKTLAKKTKEGTIVRYQTKLFAEELGEVKLSFLYPLADLRKETTLTNETSVILKSCYKVICFLLTGDSGTPVEQELLAKKMDVQAAVLKVGHHGSRYSTGEDWLKVVRPKWAVISAGKKNRYGHPAYQTLWRLKKFGVKVSRTDQIGTIVLKTDGVDLWED